jgi:hypothetical protein
MSIVRTYTGRDVALPNPSPDTIDIRDIACSLSRINRFNGATKLPLNMADHSITMVSILAIGRQPPLVQMLGLLHDAHEAYIGDITTPVRQEIAAFAGFDVMARIASRLDRAIRLAFGLAADAHVPHVGAVLAADRAALGAEWRDLMEGPPPFVMHHPCPFPIKPRSPDRAEEEFLRLFGQLRREIGPLPSLITTTA